MSDQARGPGWWLASDGKWYPPESLAAVSSPPPTNASAAVASLVLGIVSVFLFFLIIPPVLAIVFGLSARREIASSGGSLKGNGMAVGGIVLGVLCLLAWFGSTMPD